MLGVVIADILDIANITDITTDIADITVEISRHI